jgi:hypothetical protein
LPTSKSSRGKTKAREERERKMKRGKSKGKRERAERRNPRPKKNSQTLCISPSNRHKKGGHDSPPDTHNPAKSKVSKTKRKKEKKYIHRKAS